MRLMAHRVVLEGREYRLGILTVMPDGSCKVDTFGGEVHSVRFFNGTLAVGECPAPGARLVHVNPAVWHVDRAL